MPNEKDTSEKILEDWSEVFADIINNLLFDGRQVIKPEELKNVSTASQFKMADGILHEQERDTIKLWKRGAFVIAAIGMENQTKNDVTIPLRLFSYDGAVYKTQVSQYEYNRKRKLPVAPFYPVVTLVLYFGSGHWNSPGTLRDCFQDVPPELQRYIPDYAVHVVEVAHLTPEQVSRFQSDFRFVADYLVQKRSGKPYVPPDGEIAHVDETLKLMGAITGDNSFQNAVNALRMEGKEQITMCEVVQSFKNEGYELGRKETKKIYEARLADQDRELADKDRELEDKDRELADKDRELEDKDRELEDKDRELLDKDRELLDKDRELEDKDRELLDKDRELADKDRELLELKQRYGLL